MPTLSRRRALQVGAASLLGLAARPRGFVAGSDVARQLYVATPGIRDYLEYGGHGLLVFDIDNGHKFVRRIATGGLSPEGKPLNVKGICACAATGRVYISTTKQLMCLDLTSDNLLWEKSYVAGCDRMSITPDGSTLFLPSFEGPIWNVVDARNGDILAVIRPDSGAHNTIVGPDGREAYLAGLKSPLLTIADCKTHRAVRTVGPFSGAVRPFTVNGRQTLVFANVNDLLGFEVGDLKSGKVLNRIEVEGFSRGPVKRHGCPSHGIGLTPDESELWLADSHNQHIHIFDATEAPPRQKTSIKVKDEPGWVTFSIDGTLAYPSTGEVIDVKSKQIVTELRDEAGRGVQSEKLLEIDFRDDRPARAGNQFGLGQVGAPDGIAP